MHRSGWIDHLRSFITLLVVAHHASLAYTTFAFFDASTYINSTAPVVDEHRWIGMDIFENFNDIFFMSLMFFISGLFVVKSIDRKGHRRFITDRAKKLGIPFIITVTFIIPFAYIPSYYLASHSFEINAFIKDYFVHQQWPVGPPWFIWILLLFNCIAMIIPTPLYHKIFDRIAIIANKPALLIFIFFTIAILALMPLSLWVGQYTWTGFGPFDFQLNRILLYFVFFWVGACLGSKDWEAVLFKQEKLLGLNWKAWLFCCLLCYALVELFSFYAWTPVKQGRLNVTVAYIIFDVCFSASCISSSLAMLAIFRRGANKQSAVWQSLSSNAYGIYLLHYVFITWLQFLLLKTSLPITGKFFLVVIGSVVLSWCITHFIRKNKLISRII